MGRRSAQDLSQWFHFNVDLHNRLLYLGGHGESDGITHAVAEQALKGLFALDAAAQEGDRPITMILNSPGGDVTHGLAIHDAIRACKNQVVAMVYGQAQSMGSLVLQACSLRILSPSSVVMVHSGGASFEGHPKDLDRWNREMARTKKTCEGIYLARIRERRPDYTQKSLEKLLDFDTYLSPQEAVELGLADKVLN